VHDISLLYLPHVKKYCNGSVAVTHSNCQTEFKVIPMEIGTVGIKSR
jgi:hypothetical protein